jgi:transcriptional regulator with XRE-family HTH domain
LAGLTRQNAVQKKKSTMRTDPLNAEFMRLLAKAGWKKAEAARRLELTPAVITRYFNGETRPSLTTLKLFKLLLGDATPLPGDAKGKPVATAPGYRPMAPWEEELLEVLRGVDPSIARKLAQQFTAIASQMPVDKTAKKGKKA